MHHSVMSASILLILSLYLGSTYSSTIRTPRATTDSTPTTLDINIAPSNSPDNTSDPDNNNSSSGDDFDDVNSTENSTTMIGYPGPNMGNNSNGDANFSATVTPLESSSSLVTSSSSSQSGPTTPSKAGTPGVSDPGSSSMTPRTTNAATMPMPDDTTTTTTTPPPIVVTSTPSFSTAKSEMTKSSSPEPSDKDQDQGKGDGEVEVEGDDGDVSMDRSTGEESDFGKYGLLAFGLTLSFAILLLYALLLVILVPRCCKKRGMFNVNSDDAKESRDAPGDVIPLGERPHKPIAPMMSATGLNGEFITAVDLEEEVKVNDSKVKDEDKGAAAKEEGKKEGKEEDDNKFVSTFLIGRLSTSNQGASESDSGPVAAADVTAATPSSDVTPALSINVTAVKAADDDMVFTSTPIVSDDEDYARGRLPAKSAEEERKDPKMLGGPAETAEGDHNTSSGSSGSNSSGEQKDDKNHNRSSTSEESDEKMKPGEGTAFPPPADEKKEEGDNDGFPPPVFPVDGSDGGKGGEGGGDGEGFSLMPNMQFMFSTDDKPTEV